MSGDKDNETPEDIPKLDKGDTLRPPAGTDAYTAETVVRQAPPELIAAARAARREQLGRNLQPDAAPAASAAPVADEADGPLPAIDDAESVDGDNVETQLWQASRNRTGDASTRMELEPTAPLDNTNPLFVMFVLLAALVAGAGLAYWLSAPPH